MEPMNVLISLKDFVAQPATTIHSKGVKTTINLPRAILELRHEVLALAAKNGGIAKFHIPERDLYRPVNEIFRSLLPSAAIIDKEAVLKKLQNGQLKTDLSIRNLYEFGSGRLDGHDFVVLIEMKSVFYGEHAKEADLLADLEKLLDCETAYAAKCFFVLVGLEADLKKSSKSLTKFGLNNSVGPISMLLPNGKTAWLLPSARHVDTSPQVFVWTVSNNEKFPADASDYSFSVFQTL